MKRLTIFVKGNLDVRDTLHSSRLGGKLIWNGINEVLRERAPDTLARVRHETWTRSDALLEATGTIPPVLAERNLSLGAYPLVSQFSPALFEADADAFVLSIQPDLNTSLLRHCRDGFLFYPNEWRTWSAPDQDWLRESFVGTGFIDPIVSLANFGRVIDRIQAHSRAPILIYNVSSVVPGDEIHDHRGMEDLLSTRIRRFNLGLIELSQKTGASVIDVDNLVARDGANALKYGTLHLTGAGCRALAEEVARVLEDLRILPTAEGNR